mgnify:CR=1 FL=1
MAVGDGSGAGVGVVSTFGSSVTTIGVSVGSCLLYTSDAADERSSVDLGGRRIIKKKTNSMCRVDSSNKSETQ